MKRTIRLTAIAVVATVSAMAAAQNGSLGGSVGLYMPTNATVRAALGSSAMRFGFGPVDTETRQEGFKPSFGVINVSKNGNRLLAIPVTYGFERKLGSSTGPLSPYYRVFGGAAYLDYRIGASAGRRFAPVFGGEVGLTLSSVARVYARYSVFSSTGGLNFSGLELVASFSLFKL